MNNYASQVISTVFERMACLMSMCHGKKLLLIHGIESFSDYISNYFDLTKDKKNKNFINNLKGTEEYKELFNYLEETKTTKNHPKLKKLLEILLKFFQDEKHISSKVIIFS
jgi:ERCC4-related helicase